MIMQDDDSSALPIEKQRVIWFAFLGAPIIYGVIAYFVAPEAPAVTALPIGFWWAIAAAAGAGSFLLPRFRKGSSIHETHILGWAIAEFIGVLGLVQLFRGEFSLQNAYAFLGIAFVIILLQFPRD